MNIGLITTTAAAAILFAAAQPSFAQSYILVPGDSITGSISMEDLTVFNIEQHNTTTDTLTLGWQQISASVPPSWEASICDNGMCYTDLHLYGTQTVYPGEYGLSSLHITAHGTAGTATIQYLVWNVNVPTAGDTLTWIITALPTGIEETNANAFNVLRSRNQLTVQFLKPTTGNLTLYDITGNRVTQQRINAATAIVNTTDLPAGTYIVQVQTSVQTHQRKIILTP